MNLDDMEVKGYTVLKMVADDNEQNRRIHDAFRALAKVECRNDYTVTLEKLLQYYEEDAKTQMLYQLLQEHESRISSLEATPVVQEEGNGGTF